MSTSARQVVRSVLKVPLLGPHRGKEANKFQFDITVERIFGASAAEYSLKWCRGVKTAKTKPFFCDPKAKEGVDISQKLSLLCTLYRSKTASDALSFDEKDSKISLISHKEGKKNDKTVGKVHFNLAEFAGVPGVTRKQSFHLNYKTRVDVTITCTFVRTSDGTTSSIGSGMSGMTQSSGECEDDQEDNTKNSDSDTEPKGLFSDIPAQVSIADSDTSTIAMAGGSMEFPADRKSKEALNENCADDKKCFDESSNREEAKKKRTKLMPSSPVYPPSVVTFKGKATLAALETDIEHLQKKLEDSRKETEKGRIVNQMSEDLIRELRERLEYNDGKSTARNLSQDKELQKKVDELQVRIATSTLEHRCAIEKYESRVATLKTQVDTLERTKARVERERTDIQDQFEDLQTKLQSGSLKPTSERWDVKDRELLLLEISKMRETNENISQALASERLRVAQLEVGTREAKAENIRLSSKIDAHEAHAAQIKITYEELSRMYTDIRTEHIKLQTELKTTCDSGGSGSLKPMHERSKFLRRLRGDKADKESDDTFESKEAVTEISRVKEELQETKRKNVEAEREKHDAEQLTASLRGDLRAALAKIEDNQRDTGRLNELLESMKTRYLLTSEQLEDAMQFRRDMEHQHEVLRKRHRDEIAKLMSQNEASLKHLESNCSIPFEQEKTKREFENRIKQLDIELAEALTREEKFHAENLRMVQVIDGLNQLVRELKERAEKSVERHVNSSTSEQSGREKAVEVENITSYLKERQAKPLDTVNIVSENKNCQQKIPEYKQGCRSVSSQESKSSKAAASEQSSDSNEQDEVFISSSSIRKVNMIEKITDGRLLNMLVETKMKLAVSEEEKVRQRFCTKEKCPVPFNSCAWRCSMCISLTLERSTNVLVSLLLCSSESL
jgi:N-terminal C2 in EEIG1 and EHBP1 proteins